MRPGDAMVTINNRRYRAEDAILLGLIQAGPPNSAESPEVVETSDETPDENPEVVETSDETPAENPEGGGGGRARKARGSRAQAQGE